MNQKAYFMKIWEKEAPATRKVIERIPQDRSDYRADPKARTAREIAWLLIREQIALGEGFDKGSISWSEVPTPDTVKEILETYDTHYPQITSTLRNAPESTWEKDLPFLWQGQEVMRAPAHETAWSFLLDMVHHRGQLSTYLRPMGSTVPAIYGPSADES